MEIHVERIPGSKIVYMRRTGAYGEQNYTLMQDMKEWVRRHDFWREGGVIYGIAQDDAAVMPPERCRYDVCFVTDEDVCDDAVERGFLPGGTYLVACIPHTPEEIGRFWGSIENIAAREGRQLDHSRPVLERYAFALVQSGFCEFCIPVHG